MKQDLKNFLDRQGFTRDELRDIEYISEKVTHYYEFVGDKDFNPTDSELIELAIIYSALQLAKFY